MDATDYALGRVGVIATVCPLCDVRGSLLTGSGRSRREDYEYRRQGTRTLLLARKSLAALRQAQEEAVAVIERHTIQDFVHQIRWLVDEVYPEAPVVRFVLDNLNAHRKASLYEAFPAAEARRIARRLEFHHTPGTAVGQMWRR